MIPPKTAPLAAASRPPARRPSRPVHARPPRPGGHPPRHGGGGNPLRIRPTTLQNRIIPADPIAPLRPLEQAREFNPLPGAKLRVIPLGGQEEVGRNMTVIEYGTDIIIIDMGLQFPEEDMPGIDYIIPNISYLKGKEKNIKGVIITHGHYDHIGGIPHHIPKLGYPTIFGTALTLNIIRRRQEDYTHLGGELTLKEVNEHSRLSLGRFKVEFLHINHNIPQSLAIVVKTPVGTIVHTGDWKFDFNPVGEEPADFGRIAEIGKQGVLALLGDSTNATEPGHQMSEREIGETLRAIFQNTKGRLIIGTFASLLSRVQQIVNLADEFGRKVAIDGFSMRTNVAILQEMGYLKIKRETLIDIRDVDRFPPHRVVVLGTGAQGEANAVLMRIANREHRFVRITPNDTVIFSSSVVPGNERSVQRLKDTLYREGAKVIHYKMMDVHAGGHAKQEDIKLMLNLMKPRYYVPIEANHFMLKINGEVAETVGIPKERIFIASNGQVMEFDETGKGVLTKEKVPTDYIFVDGLGVGDVSGVVLRDRQMMSADGMFVIILTLDRKSGALVSSPDLISRGFIYMKENKQLIDETRHMVKKSLDGLKPEAKADPEYMKEKIREVVGQFLFQKTQRRPMILPVIIEV